MAGHRKGAAWEREICTKLSKWWTNGARDDIFWRTSGSGARAKTRSKKGQATTGQHGDVTAIDPIGEPLIKTVMIELKRGYSRHTIFDLLDTSGDVTKQKYGEWILKCSESRKQARVPYWMLITKRDRHEPVVTMPLDLFESFCTSIEPSVKYLGTSLPDFFTTCLSVFLNRIHPKNIERLYVRHRMPLK